MKGIKGETRSKDKKETKTKMRKIIVTRMTVGREMEVREEKQI